MSQSTKIIDITRSFIPVDPKQFPATMHGTGKEDNPEERVPVVPYKGYNFLPTSYGYKSFFGTKTKLDLNPLVAEVDAMFVVQSATYQNKLVALASDGIYTSIAGTGVTGVWTKEITTTLSGVPWTYCVISNVLYCYKQGGPSHYKLDLSLAAGTFVTVTPTFLNMAGQMGIFKAGGRLGYWDSANSVSWSNQDDTGDFVPSLETLAGNAIFQDVLGRITVIHGHDEGFIIYASKSIVLVRRSFESTMMWDPKVLYGEIGIAYMRQVARAQPDTTHFAYTAAGIIKIENAKADFITTALHDVLAQTQIPTYLRYISGRYLFMEILDKEFLYGLVDFRTYTLQDSVYLPEWSSAFVSYTNMEDPATNYGPAGIPRPEFLALPNAHDQHVLQKTQGPLEAYPRNIDIPELDGFYEVISDATNVNPSYVGYQVAKIVLDYVASLHPTTYVAFRDIFTTCFASNAAGASIMNHLPAGSYQKIELTTTGEKNLFVQANLLWQKLDAMVTEVLALDGNPMIKETGTTYTQSFMDPDLYFQTDGTAQTRWTGNIATTRANLAAIASQVSNTYTDKFRRPSQEHATWLYTKWDESAVAFNDTGLCIQRNALERVKYRLDYRTQSYTSIPAASNYANSLGVGISMGMLYTFAEFIAALNALIGTVDSNGYTFAEYRLIESSAGFTGTTWNNDDANATLATEGTILAARIHWIKAGLNATSSASFGGSVLVREVLTAEKLATETLTPNSYTMKAYTKLSRYYQFDNNGNRVSSATPPPTFVPLNPNTYKPTATDPTRVPMIFAHLAPSAFNAYTQDETMGFTHNNRLIPGQTVTSTFTYEEIPAVVFPPSSFILQSGTIAPEHPVMFGAFVFDTQLKKWGSMRLDYYTLLDYFPLNNSDEGTVPYAVFGMQAGAYLTDASVALFSEDVDDSQIYWGRIGYYRQGMTTAQEIRVTFGKSSTGYLLLEGSLDNKTIETGLDQIETITNAVTHTMGSDKTAKWFNVGLAGQFDITGLEFRGHIAGRR